MSGHWRTKQWLIAKSASCHKQTKQDQLSRKALKGPLSKFNGIGHAIRSEPYKLLIKGALELGIPLEIAKRIARL
jgi:hypothetical protein